MQIEYLSGLRGVFALSVVFFHCLFIFLPSAVTGSPETAHLTVPAEWWLAYLPQFLYNGNCAVCVFFVLSGFVLGIRFWQERDIRYLISSACRRYIRLTGPVLASVLFAWLLFRLGWLHNHEVAAVAGSMPLVDLLYRTEPDFWNALREGLWTVYFAYEQPASYNPVLWTMETELKGSFLAFSFLALFGSLRRRWMLYLVLVLLSFKTYYLAFVLGIGLSDLVFSQEGQACWERLRQKKSLLCISLAVGVLFGSYTADGRNLLFAFMHFGFFDRMHWDSEAFYHVLGAGALVYLVLQLRCLQCVLSVRWLTLLGRYSFSLYLVHVPVMFSLGGKVFLHFLRQGMGYGMALTIAMAACLPVIAVCTCLLQRFADAPSGRLARAVQGYLMR